VPRGRARVETEKKFKVRFQTSLPVTGNLATEIFSGPCIARGPRMKDPLGQGIVCQGERNFFKFYVFSAGTG
jgi:hypothetical protein